MLRRLDTPDGRWIWLLRRGRVLAAQAARAADEAVVRHPVGAQAVDLDQDGTDVQNAVALRFTQGFASAEELYAALPAHARQSVNRYDFADFVQQLQDSTAFGALPGRCCVV